MAIVEEPTNDPSTQSSASGIIIAYLMERVHEYRVLDAIRQQVITGPSRDLPFAEMNGPSLTCSQHLVLERCIHRRSL